MSYTPDLDEVRVTQTAHGLTLPAYGLVPLVYDNGTSLYKEACGTLVTDLADIFVVKIPDANTLILRESGVITKNGHGLDVGYWYNLGPMPGTILRADGPACPYRQTMFFVLNPDQLLLRCEPGILDPDYAGDLAAALAAKLPI